MKNLFTLIHSKTIHLIFYLADSFLTGRKSIEWTHRPVDKHFESCGEGGQNNNYPEMDNAPGGD